jgi:hypothetical protein
MIGAIMREDDGDYDGAMVERFGWGCGVIM